VKQEDVLKREGQVGEEVGVVMVSSGIKEDVNFGQGGYQRPGGRHVSQLAMCGESEGAQKSGEARVWRLGNGSNGC